MPNTGNIKLRMDQKECSFYRTLVLEDVSTKKPGSLAKKDPYINYLRNYLGVPGMSLE
jgi:hypothetical protein